MPPKDANWIANNLDPDHTAPSGEVRSRSTQICVCLSKYLVLLHYLPLCCDVTVCKVAGGAAWKSAKSSSSVVMEINPSMACGTPADGSWKIWMKFKCETFDVAF